MTELQHLVIKPTLACTARCPTCAPRRELHRRVRAERQLAFEDWERVLAEARDLGVWEFTLSGGEPTLYDRLADLARIGSSYSWVVRINTNGSMIDETMARRLLDAGVLGPLDLPQQPHDGLVVRRHLAHGSPSRPSPAA